MINTVNHKIKELLLIMMKFGCKTDCQENDTECVKYVAEYLKKIGFSNDLKIFGDTANLYSTIGVGKKTLCFCGHCDVVPAGKNWSKNFNGEIIIENGLEKIYGRGAVDMLGGNVAWIIAVEEILQERPDIVDKIKIATLLTGNEEGDGKNGTIKMVDYLSKNNISFDACIVGEPTTESDENELDVKKLDSVCYGRQGSFGFFITIKGKTGHIAYPNIYNNPIKSGIKLCNALYKIKWNNTTHLEIMSFDAKNNTTNVVMNEINIFGDVRFFDITKDEVEQKILDCCKNTLKTEEYYINIECNRVGYKTDINNDFFQLVLYSVKKYNKEAKPVISMACTDGEYMTKISKSVCEFGLKTTKMHQPDEYVLTRDLNDLKNIYKDIIIKFATMI